MKIALIGTHGTGKTTIVHEIVSKLKKRGFDVDFLGEIARQCPFPINEKTTKKSQIWMILKQITSEMEIEERCNILVSDRSVIDYYVYYVNKFGRSDFLEPLIRAHLKTYSSLLKIPIRQGFLTKDKIRSTNKKFQRDIEEKFDKILKIFNVKYISLKNNLSTPESDIIEKVLKTII